MHDILLQLYLAAFFILVFFRAEAVQQSGNNEDFLSVSRAGMVRACAAVAIMLHHLMQQLTTYGAAWRGPVSLFNDAGFLCTAVFFFFSGYGLLRSLQTKPEYLRSFLYRRLPAILIPFWTVNLILILAGHFIYGYHKSAERILSELLGFRLIDGNGWFIVEIACLYLGFWLFFTIFEDQRDIALLIVSAFVFVLMAYAFFPGHDPQGDASDWFRGEWWHNSTIAFVYGLMWARFRSSLEMFFRRHYAFLLVLFTAFSGATFIAAFWAVRRYGYYRVFPGSYAGREATITFFAQAAACLAVITLILLLMMKIRIGNLALRFIESISLELFLVHGVFVDPVLIGLKRKPVLYCAAVFAVSIVCAFAVSLVTRPTVRAVQDILGNIFGGRGHTQGTLEAEAAKHRRKRQIRLLRRILFAAAVLLAVCSIYFFEGNTIFAKKRFGQQCDALKNCKAGDEVLWGQYETDQIRPGKERLKWIVLRKDGSEVLLITKEGIAGSSYHRRHEAVSWEKCGLKEMLDSEMFPGMFTRYEKEAMEGGITLLTAVEARKYFNTDQDRELTVTAAARSGGTNTNSPSKHHYWDMKGYRTSWWWLRGEDGVEMITAPIVTVDGTIEEDTKYVNKPGGAIRPVIRLHIP